MKHLAFLLSKSKVSRGRFLLKHGKQERFPSYSAIFRRNANVRLFRKIYVPAAMARLTPCRAGEL